MRTGCKMCGYMKMTFKGTLDGKPYCQRFKKYIPECNMEYNFFCDGDINGTKRDNRLS